MNQQDTASPHHQPDEHTLQASLELERHHEFDELTRKAFVDRPKFSIRMQIHFSVIFSFLVILGIAIAQIMTVHMMGKKIYFLEVANNYLFEIQQARRFEKNFFLYGTNLPDAIESARQAKMILDQEGEQIQEVVGADAYGIIRPHLDQYALLLDNLAAHVKQETANTPGNLLKDTEINIRRHGQEMVTFANELKQKEERALQKMIRLSRNVHMYSLLFLFLVILFNTYLLRRRILAPIKRYVNYTQKIAAGEYSQIKPTRSYRDEFSDLALAINLMINDLKLHQDILIQSHKLKAVGTLTAGVAHELNNPLNNITLTAHMLQEDFATLSEDEKREMIDDIIHETGRSKRIVSNLLDFARESESRLEPLDIGQVIQETLDLASNQVKIKGVRIDLHMEDSLPHVNGDKQQLYQVFLNLIFNALDVTPKGGSIEIQVRPGDTQETVLVAVTDHGPGIPEHILQSVFDPFFTTKAQQGGTGLGLSVTQGIVAKHGGEIRVSTEIDHGSTFFVELPVSLFR